MIFSGIIWNAAYKYSNEIILDISDKYKVLDAHTYDMNTNYNQFVRDVYKFDNIPEFRITSKINAMEKFPVTKINLLDIDIPKLTKEFMPRKKRYTFAQIEELKTFIRTKYSALVIPYLFDIVFHMTDTAEERENLLGVLAKYERYKVR